MSVTIVSRNELAEIIKETNGNGKTKTGRRNALALFLYSKALAPLDMNKLRTFVYFKG